MIKVGVIGATGYAGQQLVWLLNNHPEVEIEFLASHSYGGEAFSSIYRNFNKFLNKISIEINEVEKSIKKIDILFTALPHGKSFEFVQKALESGVKVIDLGADFRINDTEIFSEWYKIDHRYPDLSKEAVYGLSELNRDKIKDSKLIANPGCYPTASILALAPLLKNNLLMEDSILIDAKSGVSGAGRGAKVQTLYAECNESIKAYGVASHRHTPEIEQELSILNGSEITLTFTPHLVPMNRGILSVCYGKLKEKLSENEIFQVYKAIYGDENFIRLTKELPETRWVKNSNFCDISFRIDKRTGRIIVVSAIDNLMKGAAGQAIQNMNIMFGLKETKGLDLISMVP
ncbi:N-acetyl-gamma-glutamyl-phosphate reductase [Oceanirhabdus sp. W0125-5]|uniref:N-acetyl-gamma-glutamyl-phosphate reductase n=1 Tax=Oceanirhabdus sp. W0125-5 TaxID=2999116 RepID=UPI0022F2CD27|nr:N-acetyl-gamma-glutamyl-phosphate reductase [Oceanirhabdus sp. W0125-5]WBW95699.1 N-acetyl-gamma-glutamyl-phosphate reductase [Oceanirhabdus sp. W0125-5]